MGDGGNNAAAGFGKLVAEGKVGLFLGADPVAFPDSLDFDYWFSHNIIMGVINRATCDVKERPGFGGSVRVGQGSGRVLAGVIG